MFPSFPPNLWYPLLEPIPDVMGTGYITDLLGFFSTHLSYLWLLPLLGNFKLLPPLGWYQQVFVSDTLQTFLKCFICAANMWGSPRFYPWADTILPCMFFPVEGISQTKLGVLPPFCQVITNVFYSTATWLQWVKNLEHQFFCQTKRQTLSSLLLKVSEMHFWHEITE